MIIVRAPYRISLWGGSTDYESFYSKHGALIVGFTIDKYIYICLHKNYNYFDYKSRILYSSVEFVNSHAEIQNPGVRGVLEYFKCTDGLQIAIQGDLPAQSGTGSSSAMAVALAKGLDFYFDRKLDYSKKQLAKVAIFVEREMLKESGGIQDQIWAAYGGVNSIEIFKDGDFVVRPIPVSEEFLQILKDRLVFCYAVEHNRQSFTIAQSHDSKTEETIAVKQQMKNIAEHGLYAFQDENIDAIGRLLHQSWLLKRSISDRVSTEKIDQLYSLALKNGAIGGKLLGAGGSGFMLFLLNEGVNRDAFIKDSGLEAVDFNFSYGGAEVLLK